MKKTIEKNENFLEIEASEFLTACGEQLVRISHRQLATEKGPQTGMTTHTRITSGENKGYIATSETIWPRCFATEADLDLMSKSQVKDLMLRFGWGKKVMVTDEQTGEEHEIETWGAPKWVAWFDGKDWHELQGPKVPFGSSTDASESVEVADGDSDEEGEEES